MIYIFQLLSSFLLNMLDSPASTSYVHTYKAVKPSQIYQNGNGRRMKKGMSESIREREKRTKATGFYPSRLLYYMTNSSSLSLTQEREAGSAPKNWKAELEQLSNSQWLTSANTSYSYTSASLHIQQVSPSSRLYEFFLSRLVKTYDSWQGLSPSLHDLLWLRSLYKAKRVCPLGQTFVRTKPRKRVCILEQVCVCACVCV